MDVNILVVEDDASLCEWLADYLTNQGYQVTTASRGDIAVELIRDDNPDAVLLDINLPGLDGLQVCKTVREFYQRPILMLTAYSEESDEVLGLEIGADDYLTKPVRARALLARLRTLLRRGETAPEQSIHVGNLRIEKDKHTAFIGDQVLDLNPNEFDVLVVLAEHAGDIVSRDDLVSQMRGIEYDGFDRSIDIRVSRLRKKLALHPDAGIHIKTMRSKGYVLVIA